MKLLCCFIVTLAQLLAFGQINYTPVLVDACSEYDHFTSWKIEDKKGNGYLFDRIDQKGFNLPDTGVYVLSALFDDIETMEIKIDSNNQVDTFYTRHLEVPAIISNPPPNQFHFCGEIAEGYCVDYYKNGKVRTEGKFKNGHPKDTVKTYFYSGEVKELVIPLRKGKKYLWFYPNGNIEREYNSQKSTDKEYFESGQLAFFRHYREFGGSEEVEFYENGQLKREQAPRTETRYSSVGKVTEKLKRIKTYGYFDRNFRSYLINWKKFDSFGKLKMEIKFDRMEREHPAFPQKLSEIDSTDFKEIMLFEDEKPTQKIVIECEYINQELVYKVIFFTMKSEAWTKQREGTLEELRQFF